MSCACDANIALAVRQQRPETLEEAVSCTLEMESYALLRKEEPTRVAAVQEEEQENGYDVCIMFGCNPGSFSC